MFLFQGRGRERVLDDTKSRKIRTLFLSDVHLGTKACQAHLLLDFLKHVEAETIYLVGDIIDGWRLKSGWYWPQSHNDVVQKLMRKVRPQTGQHGNPFIGIVSKESLVLSFCSSHRR